MRLESILRACAVGTLALGAAHPASVVAEECVNIVHYESSGEKGSMDPADLLSSDDSVHVYAVYNRLVDIDDNFQVVPELAKSWSVSEDGRTWTFELEQGVKFHDGSDFDSGDVVYSLRRLLDPEVGSGAAPILSFLKPEGIQAVDAHTVRFETDDPIADMPTLLSLKFNLIVSEGAQTADLKLNGMGTGPFMQEEFTPGGAVRVLRRNPNYWREGLPKAECLRVTVITEAVSQLAALKSGEADLLMSAAPEILSALRGDENVTLLETGAATSLTFSMQTDKEPFNDNRVREALKAVVNRQEIVNTALLGLGQPGNDNPVPPSWPAAYTAEIKGQDIEARQGAADRGGLRRRAHGGSTYLGRPARHEARRPGLSAAGGRGGHHCQHHQHAAGQLLVRYLDEACLLLLRVVSACARGGSVHRLRQGGGVERDQLAPRRLPGAARRRVPRARCRQAGGSLPAGPGAALDGGRGDHSRLHASGRGDARQLFGLQASRPERQLELRRAALRVALPALQV